MEGEAFMNATVMAAPVRAGRKEWIGLAVLALPTLLLALDMSVLYLALPHLAADLRPDSSQLLWIMDIYGFMIAGFLITMGTLGDRIGRRRLLLIGAVAFAAASVFAAYSTSAGMLIASRTVLGIAGATLMPSTLALISNMFKDPRQRSTAIAVWMSCFMGGVAVGPVIGGAVLATFWWGAVFLLGVPVMVVLLVAAPLLLPEYRDPDAGRLDLASVVLSLATILPIVFGLKELAKNGPGAAPLVAIVIGLVVGVGFVRRQLRLADPLFDLRLFRNASFRTAVTTMLIAGLIMGGMFLLISQYLQLVAGLSPLRAGLLMVPTSVAMVIGTMLGPAMAARFGRWEVIAAGLAVGTVGFGLLTQADAAGGLPVVLVGLVFAAGGLGPVGALVTEIVVGSAPPEKAGSAASMSETSGEFGIAMGVALMGSLATAVYRGRDTVPAGAAAELTAPFEDSLASAVAATEGLPTEVAARLLEPAREAFVAGMNVVAVIGSVVMVACATVVFVRRRRTVPPS